ncbi:MAG: Nif3-like dinuclear metal center hexameric protein [Pirellulaceae bacterium]|nr:Nif3-like dinuclear metal center hexameric protein [Planctomycetales bacterium]
MIHLHQIVRYLEELAPPCSAEDWDNVGLLAGDTESAVERIMTCLTITPETVAEAIDRHANLVVSHHPLPFRAIKSVTTSTIPGKLLWELISHRIAIYSPHTAWDSANAGINQLTALGIGLTNIRPLVPHQPPLDPSDGAGRIGMLETPQPLVDFVQVVKRFYGISTLQFVGNPQHQLTKIGIGCGSGGSLLQPALKLGCDGFLTGEANFHSALEARAAGVALVLVGHFASERFSLHSLAQRLHLQFPNLTIWASIDESDPVQTI